MVDTLSLFGEELAHEEKAEPAPLVVSEDKKSRKKKSKTAYRTISEVAKDLNVATHVLRFWETKFPEISPLKRGGGRRYYRPEDVEVLKQIQTLLYDEGYTIRGVQTFLKKMKKGEVAAPVIEEAENGLSAEFAGEVLDELREIRTMIEG